MPRRLRRRYEAAVPALSSVVVRPLLVVVAVLIVATGCFAAADDPAPANKQQVNRKASPVTVATQAPHRVAPAAIARQVPRKPVVDAFKIESIVVKHGEDGRGGSVVAGNPRALNIVAESWRGRGLDPVLSIGRLVFRKYSHPSKQVLRFIVSDVALLSEGAEVSLQYGNDTSSRVVITTSLRVR